ncbi:unnamed protein product [Taenia asiatica]|uniref:Uncharacterized protein n=1 Tax=Taenia asiatica TaxID=60517 RepID=A0A0R3W426_TAEAS|nr:unnamed protein product [Taenia asiatica]
MDADLVTVESSDSTNIPKKAVLTAHANKPCRDDLERIKQALVNHTKTLRREANRVASASEPSSGSFDVERQMDQFEMRLDKLDLQLETHLGRIKQLRTKTSAEFVTMN